MKSAKIIITLLIVVVLASIAAGYAAGFFVYRQYKEKAVYFDKQVQLTMDKFGGIESNLDELYSALDKGKMERENALSKIEKIKEDLQGWKKGYGATLSGLRNAIDDLKVDRLRMAVEGLKGDINDFKMTMQDFDLKLDEYRGKTVNLRADGENVKSVDLGKISVRKRGK
ncbi:hypothetical protein ACFL0P_00290 [Candidatus Omnitrophota bacterium]